MTKSFAASAALVAALLAAAPAAQAQALKTDEDKSLYSLGLHIGTGFKRLDLTSRELEVVMAGVRAGAGVGKPKLSEQEWAQKTQDYLQKRLKASADKASKIGAAFAERAAKQPGAHRESDGLIYQELKAGSGPSPSPSDTVRVNYEGRLVDGTVFDSSYKRGEPATFPLSGVIKCWTEGVAKMKVGGKARLVCPAEIAYADHGQGNIPPGATLDFTVELLGIEAPAPTSPSQPPLSTPAH